MQLGLFNFGLQNGFLINQSLLIPQKRLLSSYLIKIKNDLEFFKIKFFSISRFIIFMVFFFSFIFFLNAEIFINLIFGSKWIEALRFLKLFIISGTISSLYFFTDPLLAVFGLPQIISKVKMYKFPILFISLSTSYLLELKIYDTAIIFLIANVFVGFLQQIISFKNVKISIFDYYKNLLPVILNFMFGLFISVLIGKFVSGKFSFLLQTISFCFAYLTVGMLFLKTILINDFKVIKNNERL